MVRTQQESIVDTAMQMAGLLLPGQSASGAEVGLGVEFLQIYESRKIPWLALQLAMLNNVGVDRIPPCVYEMLTPVVIVDDSNEGCGFYGESAKLPISEDE